MIHKSSLHKEVASSNYQEFLGYLIKYDHKLNINISQHNNNNYYYEI
jgi:hypothetical protein